MSTAIISGVVKRTADGDLQPWLPVSLESSDTEGLRQYDAILDTGFTGSLVLPESVIAELGLAKRGVNILTLGDGEEHPFDYYLGWVSWRGERREVEVLQSIGQPLLGMELLEGAQVAVDAWEDGAVTVTFS